MLGTSTIQDRIAGQYGELSERLRQAADYIVEHEIEVATHSLRTVASNAGLAPATFSRLSQALGFSSYERMRDMCRDALGRQAMSFAQRAELLSSEEEDGTCMPFIERQLSASLENISKLGQDLDRDRLNAVVNHLTAAREVLLFGAFSSTGLIEYFAYLARYFTSNWKVAGRMGESISSAFVGLGKEDAVIILTKRPYARRAILAAEMASESGAYVIVITDRHSCPALEHASAHFIVSTESPQFFSSYAATLVLIETLVGMLVARTGTLARDRIENIETRNHRLGEFWD
ncbi:transcriptional regulator, RpiR family [Cohaesibacter sp. ES.047]|uniref:MurR/RpiR family transcriptional regulator n=1 Tax=Cohaesibacter sp. ES.047 TaxID=1798205 RepID=UPI000BB959A7|nr:MurR/RpiR family transcriptional regulator [Cohaesibacter sp. ES.047]SNY90755.1 transcriptional regulator, RpiR family [Cohaesibacter sp. ES.047]